MINTWAWCGWCAAAVVALSITRSPVYLILIFLCVTIVSTALVARRHARQGFFSPLPFLGFICLTAAVFNGLTSHYGKTVLFQIPGQIPLLSGSVTLEALVYGVINGLVLSGLFVTFMVFNQALPTSALIRLIPRAFFPVAVVVSIAVTFFPATRRQMELIREAQMVRGHRIRGVRDLLPLIMPLLVGGLERAFQLAEAMTARGFAGQEPAQSSDRSRLVMLAGLLLIFFGWLLRLFSAVQGAGLALLLSGVVLIVGALLLVGRRSTRTTYRQESWSLRDAWILLGACLTLAAFIVPQMAALPVGISYNPYPAIGLPVFNPWLGLAILGLLTPAFVTFSGPV